MSSTTASVSFKVLLSSLPRGEPLSTAALQARGLSAFRASALARSGWLVHLARGVYMLPGDTLTRDGSLAFLSEQTPGLHVGGKTALAWRGVRQNIAFRERLNLWGDNLVVPKGAPNPENAKIFLNWMMDPKNIAEASDFSGYNNAIKGSEAYMKVVMRDDPAINPPADMQLRFRPVKDCAAKPRELRDGVWTRLQR